MRSEEQGILKLTQEQLERAIALSKAMLADCMGKCD